VAAFLSRVAQGTDNKLHEMLLRMYEN